MSRGGGGAMTDAPITLADIERLAAEYAALNEALSLENTLLAAEISALIRARMPAIITQIKALWPERVAELVRSAESLLRKGLEKLPAADLRRLGVAVVPPGDVVVTQPQAADPVKTAEAILNAWAPADGAETADA